MPKRNYSWYKSPNIVIVPTTNLCNSLSPKRLKKEIPPQCGSPQHVDTSFLDDFNVDEIVDCLNNENETKKYIDSENTNINNDETDSMKILPKNSQPTQNFYENDTVQSKCRKTEINCEENITKVTELAKLDTDSQNFAACGSKTNILIKNDKKSTENDSTLFPKDKIGNLTEKIVECKDIIGENELTKININKNSETTSYGIKCQAYIINFKMLENRMFDYLNTKYFVESMVHFGTFSKIFKCKDSAGQQYVVKMLNNQSDTYLLGIKKEKIFMDIKSGIPKENLFCVYVKNSFSFNGNWCFLMEFYPKNLMQALMESQKPFHINLVQDLAKQLVAAVTLLRNNNIIHSDIKPSHILLNSTNTILKLCGFDGSYYIQEANFSPNIGTVNYRSPELILGYSVGFSIDVWATALVLHEMATGRKLFPGKYNSDILSQQIRTLGGIPDEMWNKSYYSYRTLQFAGRMFETIIDIRGQETLLMHKFDKNRKLSRYVYGAYYTHWAPFSTNAQKTNDIKKIELFIRLLDQMLVLSPNNRIAIEFVYANPFIHKMYD